MHSCAQPKLGSPNSHYYTKGADYHHQSQKLGSQYKMARKKRQKNNLQFNSIIGTSSGQMTKNNASRNDHHGVSHSYNFSKGQL
jgi:hypothetical protein